MTPNQMTELMRMIGIPDARLRDPGDLRQLPAGTLPGGRAIAVYEADRSAADGDGGPDQDMLEPLSVTVYAAAAEDHLGLECNEPLFRYATLTAADAIAAIAQHLTPFPAGQPGSGPGHADTPGPADPDTAAGERLAEVLAGLALRLPGMTHLQTAEELITALQLAGAQDDGPPELVIRVRVIALRPAPPAGQAGT
jgi:hypothetical protein